jgi:hypothetical protein
MSKEYRKETDWGEMIFSETEERASLVRVSGNPVNLEISGVLNNGIKVTSVSKKAFLGRKSLKKLLLPESIESIGGWGFAGCENLAEITLAGGGTG